ncbi:MAG TPA: 4-alpha-glucanotransferase [Candidatus Baltobacteraceae bacterium]|nr:4-alpha-glucanotransferase [Candidatus Baltobacteraceae bacterium]
MIVEDGYTDFYGAYHAAPPQTKRAILRALGPDEQSGGALEPVYVFRAGEPANVPGVPPGERFQPGYYEHAHGGERTTLIAVPPHAYVPEELERRGRWGIAAQLYSLRSGENWGIGDFGDLDRLVGIALDAGAACVALNPLHALHLTSPRAASPYSPSSRFFLNPLYIDVPAARATLGAGDWDLGASEMLLRSLREADLIAYEAVAQVKLRALRELYEHHDRRAETFERFRTFVREGGEGLQYLAVYQALASFFNARDPAAHGWLQWPAQFQNPQSADVAQFARAHPAQVEFYQFLQWLADEQLARAARGAAPMTIGLYRDLAVGVDAASADVWMDREAFCAGISAGAPPDPMNERGQNWGLPPLNPRVLRRRAYKPFVDLLRANMRYAGALRIDHVMSLMRLFCIPEGMPASEGTYLRYPFEEMLGVLALESLRNRCTIVGEDLGTVPDGFRDRMARARVFSCRVLYFEDDPARYPRDAVASTGTHDLPPLRKYWEQNGVVCEGADDDTVLRLVIETYRRLGSGAALLVLAQLEDLLLVREQVNTPGTVDELPNWQQKIPVALEDLPRERGFRAVARALDAARTG